MPAASFPADFLWGTATSAYQIEGSPLADGAGESIWHRFAHTPGKVLGGEHGDVACDHYQRYADDVRLMRELGLQAYRFSIAWPRVLPAGAGRPNPQGLDFYSRLVDSLLEHHIQPMATLYHWDFPAALEDRGGWAASESADWFAKYAQLMFRTLGDRVKMWATFNEPWVTVDAGYVAGVHAPGRRDLAEAMAVSRNLLRAHGAAVVAGRAEGDFQIGLVVNLVPFHPATESDADREAARRMDAYLNRQYLDPALRGEVPAEMGEMFNKKVSGTISGPGTISGQLLTAPRKDPLQKTVPDTFLLPFLLLSDADLRLIRQPIDFVGVNYYLRQLVRDDPTIGPTRAATVHLPDCPRTEMGWDIYPEGLTDTLLWVKERYGDVPLYITENGAAFNDKPDPNGTVNDTDRVQYLQEHLRAARRAIERGVNLRGYFVWSLLDNFEWQFGYSKRFGVVGVDFATQRRTPKASARFYSNVIRTNGAALES